ncbi:rCG43010, isoform CRA_a [Rattus norvegicus]|uniref:RCG43010, isoform CRA_a n=1 Tax=Rattus norvegicus TaxID=10116 RepID=A6IWM6_RAT|nr:rCG43010, isoform CRA_a [Rattus norvegicus]
MREIPVLSKHEFLNRQSLCVNSTGARPTPPRQTARGFREP